MVVSLIDESSAAILDTVSVWGIWSERHQDDRVVATHTKIHPLLKAGALTAAHLNIGDDVIAHDLIRNNHEKLAKSRFYDTCYLPRSVDKRLEKDK